MINNVSLVGRLTKDPNSRYTNSGKAVASFTLAVNRNFTNQAGEREADFITCVIWGTRAEALSSYAIQGTLLGISGRIQTRSYENQHGVRVYVTEVIAQEFQLMESKSVIEARKQGHTLTEKQSNEISDFPKDKVPVSDPNDPYTNGFIDIGDDDLPF